METQLWAIMLVIIAGIIGGFAPIYLKKGTTLIDIKTPSTIYKNKFLFVGIAIYALTTMMFIPALKGGELSILYPLVGLAYVWVSIYSKFMLNERVTIIKWLGIFTIIIGVYFVGLGA